MHDGSVDFYYFLELVYLYWQNIMIPDSEKANDWFQKAYEAGYVEEQSALGLIPCHEIGNVQQDVKAAMQWFPLATIDLKHERVYWLLGRSLY